MVEVIIIMNMQLLHRNYSGNDTDNFLIFLDLRIFT